MNYRRDIEQSPLDGAPTMAAPAAGQQPGAWPQQAPYGEPGPYPSYGQRPPPYGQQSVPEPNPEREQKQDPGDFRDPETGADTRGKQGPPGCTEDQKAPAQPAP